MMCEKMSSPKNLALEANNYSLWGNVSWKRSLDFRKSYYDLCCPGCFPQEHGPCFNLRKNVDLMQGLSLGHVPFFVTSRVLCFIHLGNRKYRDMEFDPQFNHLGFQNLGEWAD